MEHPRTCKRVVKKMNWKLVKSNPNYEVSDTGLIRKIDGKNCGLWLSDGGYVLVRFSNPRKVYRVHRLVAEAFIENEKNLPTLSSLIVQ